MFYKFELRLNIAEATKKYRKSEDAGDTVTRCFKKFYSGGKKHNNQAKLVGLESMNPISSSQRVSGELTVRCGSSPSKS